MKVYVSAVLSLFLLTTFTSLSFAQEQEISQSVLLAFETNKVFDGFEVEAYSKPVTKLNLNLSWSQLRNTYNINLGHVTGLGGCLENERCGSQEWYLQGDVRHSFDEDWSAWLSLGHVSLGEFSELQGDFSQMNVGLQYTGFKWVNPYIETSSQYLHGVGGKALGLFHLGLDFTVPMSERLLLTMGMKLTRDFATLETLGRGSGWLINGEAWLWKVINKKMKIGFGVRGSLPISTFEYADRQGFTGSFVVLRNF